MSSTKISTVSMLPIADCQRVLQAGMKPDESAVEPLGTLSRSNTITSTLLSFAARAATRPAAPAPTIAMLTLWSYLLAFSNRTLLKLNAPKFLSRYKFRLPELKLQRLSREYLS